MPRGELAEALWGDDLPATWEKALSVLVSKLRIVLRDHGVDGATALTAAFGCYRLELPEGSWVDVLVAADAADEAEAALAAGDVPRAKATAMVSESLVRQPLLPGDDGTWVEQKRRDLAEVRARALRVLADASLRSGDAREAAHWAEQAVQLDPFRESGYRRLIEAHVAAGNRAEALCVFDRCRRLLADELGTYPSPETESIYQELLQAPSAPTGAPPSQPARAGPRLRVESETTAARTGGAGHGRVRLRRRGVAVPSPLQAGSWRRESSRWRWLECARLAGRVAGGADPDERRRERRRAPSAPRADGPPARRRCRRRRARSPTARGRCG